VARAVAGDGAAFAELYRRHVGTVLAYLRRRVADPEVAFDLTAETFAAAVTALPTYRAEGPFVGWLLGIARNTLLHSLRRGRVEDAARRRLGHEPLALDDEDLRSVDERATEGAAGLEAALASLPTEQREAVLARVVDERPYEEIAAELHCSEQVVRQRVHRGLRRLRADLEDAR